MLLVVDISNFEATLPSELIQEIEEKKHRVVFVANKIDTLPRGFTLDRVHLWVKNQLRSRMSPETLEQTTICLACAKKHTGVTKILEVLQKLKSQMQHLPHRPKVYVVGTTNSGKSSLINSIIQKQTKFSKGKHASQLTESALPGTTQEMITVEEFNIGLRVIDTPGIPNLTQVSSHLPTLLDLKKMMPTKEMTTYPFNVKSGYSLWLGGLARLDFVSGDDKYLTVVVPQDVTIHRTPIQRQRDVFIA
jgi:hypothetical protein